MKTEYVVYYYQPVNPWMVEQSITDQFQEDMQFFLH